MFFEIVINTYKLIFAIIFIIIFVISYFVIIGSRFESLFKQGKIWQIRVGQVLLALIIAFLATEAIMLLFPAEIL